MDMGIRKKIVLVIFLIMGSSAVCATDKQSGGWSVGLDALVDNQGFKVNQGNHFFNEPRGRLVGNPFIAYKFSNNFGLEIGGEVSKSSNYTLRINEDDNVPGNVSAAASIAGLAGNPTYWIDFESSFKQKHMYLGISGFTDFFNINKMKVMGLLGCSLSSVKASYKPIAAEDGGTDDLVDNFPNFTRTFKATDVIPMAKVAVIYDFTDHVAMRVSGTWKQISRFADIKDGNFPNSREKISLKDTYSVGLGASYSF